MSASDKLGNLAYIYGKLKEVYEWGKIAIDATTPEAREQASLEAAKKLAEAIGLGIPLWFADKAFEKTGLNRVFDSLKKNVSFQKYLKNQAAQKNMRGVALGQVADWSLQELNEWLSKNRVLDPVFDTVKDNFNNAKKWQPRRDPLILDLNGNGFETTGITGTNPIMFDHDGDGITSATGWVGAEDGFLVLDRNGNGNIDNGGELFGDSTQLSEGVKAIDGFAALADQDSNHDGIVDSQDANWNRLNVWRDLNQDGVSQANELFSLEQVGIINFKVAKTINSVFLPNGNQIADLGTYVKSDGSNGTVGEVGKTADVNLAEDTFTSRFTDEIPFVAGIGELPNIRGSGQVRNLHEAASIDNEAGRALKEKLEAYAAASSRDQQLSMLDDLILAWGATSVMATSISVSQNLGIAAKTAISKFAIDNQSLFARLDALEKFNGSNFLIDRLILDNTQETYSVNLEAQRTGLLNFSWKGLRDSVYGSLLMQTRFKNLINQIQLEVDENGMHLNGEKIRKYFETVTSNGSISGLADLIDFNKYVLPSFPEDNWGSYQLMEQLIRSSPLTNEMRALLLSQDIILDPTSGNSFNGSMMGDIILAGGTSDQLFGNNGDDQLFGGDGNDFLDGGVGNDVLSGGTGDDYLTGGAGDDIYIWGKGSGNDQIVNDDTSTSRKDVILISADTSPSEVIVRTNGSDFTLSINGTSDTLRIANGFDLNGVNQASMVNEIHFADGTVWDKKGIEAAAIRGSDLQDFIVGFSTNDLINGGIGYDSIYGAGGNDTINGGADNDTLSGGDGDDVLDGGAGNDALMGGSGNDTYVWGKGSGNDEIQELDNSADRKDIIKITEGTSPGDISIFNNSGSNGGSLVLKIKSTGETLTIMDAVGANYELLKANEIHFSDGTIWDTKAVLAAASLGTDLKDDIVGFGGNDTIYALGGNDRVYSMGGNDIVYGGSGIDVINGGDGDDTLNGGADDDRLDGGSGNNTYVFDANWGHDVIASE